MGKLKPNATYIYEKADGVIYARDIESPIEDRFVIGYDYDSTDKFFQEFADKYFLEVEWTEIIKASRTNQALHDAIERVKILYHLSNNNHE